MVVEIGKRPKEKNLGYKWQYFHPAHENASEASREAIFTQARNILGNIKQMVKSNFTQHNLKVSYKHYPKGTDRPVRLESLLMVDPNDSGISSLLTVAAMIMRINFMQEVSSTFMTLNRLESGYVIDQQRE